MALAIQSGCQTELRVLPLTVPAQNDILDKVGASSESLISLAMKATGDATMEFARRIFLKNALAGGARISLLLQLKEIKPRELRSARDSVRCGVPIYTIRGNAACRE
jgi:hypothetical protein